MTPGQRARRRPPCGPGPLFFPGRAGRPGPGTCLIACLPPPSSLPGPAAFPPANIPAAAAPSPPAPEPVSSCVSNITDSHVFSLPGDADRIPLHIFLGQAKEANLVSSLLISFPRCVIGCHLATCLFPSTLFSRAGKTGNKVPTQRSR